MADVVKPPEFKNDDEAGRWYGEHPEFLEQRYEEGATKGTLRRGRMSPQERLAEAQARRTAIEKAINVSIRLTPMMIDRARHLAERKGLKYQTYIKMLLHDALEREEAAAGRP